MVAWKGIIIDDSSNKITQRRPEKCLVKAYPAMVLKIRLATIAIIATITLFKKNRLKEMEYHASTKKNGWGDSGKSDGGYSKKFSPVRLVFTTQYIGSNMTKLTINKVQCVPKWKCLLIKQLLIRHVDFACVATSSSIR